jgi:hypothetical protein
LSCRPPRKYLEIRVAARLLFLVRIPLTLKRSLHGGKSSPPASPRIASVDHGAGLNAEEPALVARRVIDDVGPPRHDKAPRIIERVGLEGGRPF